jgi:hypothetical protein
MMFPHISTRCPIETDGALKARIGLLAGEKDLKTVTQLQQGPLSKQLGMEIPKLRPLARLAQDEESEKE